MRRMWLGTGLLAGLCAGPLAAMVPDFAAPYRISQTTMLGSDSYDLPTGPFAAGRVATETVEGAVSATAYQIDSNDLSTLQILQTLREQIVQAGYGIRFECADKLCGGFDFRFATRVIAEPAMHVDLDDFRFLSATRNGADGAEAISVLVSRSALLGFVQVIEVGAAVAEPTPPATVPTPTVDLPAPVVSGPVLTVDALDAALRSKGAVVLEDVVFASGASVLGTGDIASLVTLADWLRADSTRVVVLVGHTDTSGGQASNVVLGARRADAIRGRLVGTLGVPATQVSAAGAGYLAPRASNLTDEGRRLNRRVEVVLVPPP